MGSKLKSVFTFEKWSRVAETLLLIYVAECTFGGSGRWLEIGPLSIRMVLFGLCFAATLPLVIRSIKKLAHNFQVIITVCYGIYLIVCAWIGLRSGNALGFIWADVSTMMALALLPGFMVVMCNRRAISRAVDVVFWASMLIAVITILLHFSLAFADGATAKAITGWLNSKSLGGMALMQTGIYRMYMKSQIFLQVAIVYGIWKIGKSTGKMRITLYVCEGFLLVACILSYTRGFWLGLAASAGMLLLMGVKYWTRFLKALSAMLAVLVVFLATSWACYTTPSAAIEIVNRFDPNLIVVGNGDGDIQTQFPGLDEENTLVDESNMAAVELRAKSLEMLKEKISDHPVFGNGLGENLDGLRDDGKTEYMYLDTMMKTGLVGMILFLLTFFGFVFVQIYYSFLRKKQTLAPPDWTDAEIRNRFLTAAYLGVAVTSFFNPFLNNPMGIMLLMLTATAVYDGKPNKCEV